MKPSYLRIAVLLSLSLLLTACFGSSSVRRPPTPPRTQITGIVEAPSAALTDVVADHRPLLLQWLIPQAKALSGHVPVPGATVQAFSLPDLQPIGSTVETETEGPNKGRYTLTGIPEGVSVIIVATKGNVRLATYVERVGSQSSGNMNAATTLATEILAMKVKQGRFDRVPQADWNSAVSVAQQKFEEMSSDEQRRTVLIGGGFIVEQIGGVNGQLGDDFPDDLRNVISDDIDPDLTEAKIMVQSLRDAGYTVMSTVETKLQSYVNSIGVEVSPFASGVARAIHRVDRQLAIVLDGDKDPGVYEEVDPGDYRYLGPADSNTWVIYGYDKLRYQIRKESGTNATRAEVTVSSNSSEVHADYRLDISWDDPDQLSSFSALGTLEDDILSDRVTVDLRGSARWVESRGGDISYPEFITLDGKMNSSSIAFDGSMTIELADRSDYATIVTSLIMVSGYLQSPSLIMDGDLEIEATFRDDLGVLPTRFEFNGMLKGREQDPTEFAGGLEIVWHNPDTFNPDQPISSSNFIKGTITFRGMVEAFGQAPIRLEISLNSTNWGELRSEIDYSRGLHTLRGTGVVEYTITASKPLQVVLTDVTVNLESETGVKAELSYTHGATQISGRIWKGDKDLATIEVVLGIATVTYKDGTFDTLF